MRVTASGRATFNPYPAFSNKANDTHSYSVKACNSAGCGPASTLPIKVEKPQAPGITRFTSDKTTLTLSQSAALSWSTVNASACTLNGGSVPTSTTGHSVTPLAVGTAGYTLSCSGAVTPCASQTLNLSVTAAASETVTYLHSDTLGNVIGESKADGTFTRYHYKPYGERVESQPERLGFTGHLHQKELGLTYMQARHYDPLMGRFYGNDHIGFTGDPMSFNRYAYGNNNPFKWTDPSGETPLVIPGLPPLPIPLPPPPLPPSEQRPLTPQEEQALQLQKVLDRIFKSEGGR